MDETEAWLSQSLSDRQAAERLLGGQEGMGRCHAIAKWQQTVEKSIKAMVSALSDAGIVGTGVRAKHEVTRYVGVLTRLPRAAGNRPIQQHLHGLLDQDTRLGIKALDDLAPQFPPQRNTEYPFQDNNGQWTYPAAKDLFSSEEVKRFRELAHRILNGAGWIVSAIRRQPR